MPRFTALYFPDTLPPPAAVTGLAPLLAPLSCLRCWPGDPPPPPWSELVTAGWLELLSPFDPGPDGQRLQALLRELAGRRGEEALLFAQGLAAEFSARREETAPEVKGALLAPGEHGAERQREEERESLWQAMLLLKLAENLEQGELEMEAELRAFEAGRAELFRRLNGGEETEAERPATGRGEELEIPQRPWRQAPRLLKAWSRLLTRSREWPTMLVSADAEAWSRLREEVENRDGRVRPLVTLLLPRPALVPPISAAPATPNPGPEAEKLRQALAGVATHAPDGDGAKEEEEARAAAAAWNRQVTALEAEPGNGRGGRDGEEDRRHALEILLLPQTSLPRLVGDYQSATRGGSAPPERSENAAAPHGLLALHRPR